jgi:hypothetical protein
MIEPVKDGEIEQDFNQIKNVFFDVEIYAVSSNVPHDFAKTIIGDGDSKGILDISNDIRACLQSSYNLGGNVIDIRFEQITFGEAEIGKYPVRGLVMPIRILYRQTEGS